MFGFMKSPAKVTQQNSVDPPGSSSNPFDSDNKKKIDKPARRTSSEPVLVPTSSKGNLFDDDWGSGRRKGAEPSSSSSTPSKDRYKNDFRDSVGLENQSVQELENYAVCKVQETTKSINNCLRIAADIRDDATRTLDMLNAQGEQITRAHNILVDTEKDLSKGEKLLNNLGGFFSKTWNPKKTREIQGPVITPDNPSKKSDKYKEEKDKLLNPMPKGQKLASQMPPHESANAYQKVDAEKDKQDDVLSDLSNFLGDLKGMAVDMGTELDRQNKALNHLSDDVDEMNSRVKDSNQRARKLLGK